MCSCSRCNPIILSLKVVVTNSNDETTETYIDDDTELFKILNEIEKETGGNHYVISAIEHFIGNGLRSLRDIYKEMWLR